MTILERFLNYLLSFTTTNKKNDSNDALMRIEGGRVSVPDYPTHLLAAGKAIIPNDIQDLLPEIGRLCLHNSDFSHAVNNIVTLGNTPYTIYVEGVTQSQLTALRILIEKDAQNWFSGGLQGLRAQFLQQISVFGCISVETPPNETFNGIESAYIVSPENIVFVQEGKGYKPYQRMKYYTIGSKQSDLGGNLIALNLKTYTYQAFKQNGSLPYAIPPFIAALENEYLETDIYKHVRHIIKKVGILGFLNVLMQRPSKNPNETPEAYSARATTFLKSQIEELQKGVATGVVAGFEGAHNFSINGTNANVSGLREMFDMVTNRKVSGLKQAPALLGYQFSTTETYGRVILEMFSSQIKTYQKSVDTVLSKIIQLHLLLQGYTNITVTVESEAPTVTDALVVAQTYKQEIENAEKLLQLGIINQTQAANLLGYDKPALENPLPIAPKISNEAVKALQMNLGASEPMFEYGLNDACDCDTFEFGLLDNISKQASKYYEKLKAGYITASEKITERITNALANIDKDASLQEVQDTVLFHLYNNFASEFTDKQKGVVSHWIEKIYSKFRKGDGKIKVEYGKQDRRTIEYSNKHDLFYLGKFITDLDTMQRVNAFIKAEFIAKNLPIGIGMNIAPFQKQFPQILQNEAWKIQRIVNTTTNKMRNYATLEYMVSAELKQYTITGIKDSKQCSHCANLQNKVFSISLAQKHIAKVTSNDPSKTPEISPFVNAVISNPNDLKDLTGANLQSMNIHTPPFHPNCRDVIIML